MPYNVLILGSGGRESAFAWKISQSPVCAQLFIAPGNGGTESYGANIDLRVTDFDAIKEFCLEYEIDIIVPGPEDPLVAGIYDFVKQDPELKHIIVAGPSKKGAQLEGSKAFSKKFMERHNIPTARYQEFTAENFEEGLNWLQQQSLPIVLKCDGLAAGKGVVIATSHKEAAESFRNMIQEGAFGDAGKKVVVEQFLDGIELSVFVLSDGKNYVILPEAKDYKRIGEGDTGLNTGGMGAISPVPFADKEFLQKVENRIIKPTIDGLRREEIIYQGFIFFGLIKVAGEPYVIEYNCRMGDPETEVVMPRLENDLLELIVKMNDNQLDQVTIRHSDKAAATVMLVSGGYPGPYQKGKVISNLDQVSGSTVFHAGTGKQNGEVITSGGRVLAITSLGSTLQEALQTSYQNAEKIKFEGMYFRTDIGYEF